MEEILGLKIEKIVTCEFWLEGELITSCCLVSLRDEHRNCWQAFYDDEECVWRLKQSDQEFPREGHSTGDDEMCWRDTRPSNAARIEGKKVREVRSWLNLPLIGLNLIFEGAGSLQLTHNFDDDRDALMIE